MTHESPPGGHAGRTRGFFGAASRKLDDWLAFEPDGAVVAYSGKVELGTGVRTALAQIVADELDVDMARVRMVMAATGRTPDEGITAGSMTLKTSGMTLRRAAATARMLLLEMAAAELNAAPSELTVRDGVITPRDRPGPRVTYAGLMAGGRFDHDIVDSAPLKAPTEYRIVGTDAPRIDLEPKFRGAASFAHDVRLDGMAHARMVLPPRPGARLISLDKSAVRDARVVQVGDFVAVVAPREWDAIVAARDLRVEWSDGPALPAMADVHQRMRAATTSDQVIVERGDVVGALARATTRLSATYTTPFHAHASVGPSCAVADWDGEALRVWSPTPGPYPLREALADLLHLEPERISVTSVEGAGSYGQNGADDTSACAALLAHTLRQPVRLQWSRGDEFGWEPLAPAMVMELSAGLDGMGAISGWAFDGWSPSHANRPRSAGDLIAGRLSGASAAPPRPFYLGGERNAPTDYSLSDQRVTIHWLAGADLRVSSFRSLGAFANAFANESFMDELARAAGADPLEYRLRYLDDPRARAVVEAAARRAGWGQPLAAGMGRGLAYARYENSEAYVATIAEVAVDTATGAIHVQRVTVAHDCGQIINPDGVRNQVEGNVIQSLSRALKEEYQFAPEGPVSRDWATYPILTFSEIPDIAVDLIDRPEVGLVGAGEAATITTAPAVANAVYAACKARLRAMPFTPARVLAALGANGG